MMAVTKKQICDMMIMIAVLFFSSIGILGVILNNETLKFVAVLNILVFVGVFIKKYQYKERRFMNKIFKFLKKMFTIRPEIAQEKVKKVKKNVKKKSESTTGKRSA